MLARMQIFVNAVDTEVPIDDATLQADQNWVHYRVIRWGAIDSALGRSLEHYDRLEIRLQILPDVAETTRVPCGARLDGNVCNRPIDHSGVIHTETRDGELWASWRSILPEDEVRWGVREPIDLDV